MSRAGKSTDNPVNESLNGWIKEELFTDFNLEKSKDVPALIDRYIKFYNGMRPCYALGYDTPKFVQQKLSTFIDWYKAKIVFLVKV